MTDLSGINPMRWNEVRRRIKIVKSFAEIVRPTPEERQEAWEAMGLSRSAFDRLIKAWRETNDPALLKGRGPDRFRKWSPKRTNDERDAVSALVKNVMDQLGPEARGAAVTREIERLCLAADC